MVTRSLNWVLLFTLVAGCGSIKETDQAKKSRFASELKGDDALEKDDLEDSADDTDPSAVKQTKTKSNETCPGALQLKSDEDDVEDQATSKKADKKAKADKEKVEKSPKIKSDDKKREKGTKCKQVKTKTDTATSMETDPGTQTDPSQTDSTATDTSTETSTDTQTARVSFAKDVVPISVASCEGAGCHSGARAAKGIALDSKAGWVNSFAASLAAIEDGSMPIARNPLTAAEIEILKAWEAGNFAD